MYFVECSVLEIFLLKKNYPYFECNSFFFSTFFIALFRQKLNARLVLIVCIILVVIPCWKYE
ncbi:hypothetical protein BpHYR1_008596 [Brachionus plicatilis]|uniref:Uncharacterized protein n=1 Tax=Brachionus plicatilis TaxID=10195 RepID=A0A3M7PN24_BRAPC|nr:hypothetical protein BpHYR1_008596 [Brachionus plicatilis]